VQGFENKVESYSYSTIVTDLETGARLLVNEDFHDKRGRIRAQSDTEIIEVYYDRYVFKEISVNIGNCLFLCNQGARR
jgi:hypothetical protein